MFSQLFDRCHGLLGVGDAVVAVVVAVVVVVVLTSGHAAEAYTEETNKRTDRHTDWQKLIIENGNERGREEKERRERKKGRENNRSSRSIIVLGKKKLVLMWNEPFRWQRQMHSGFRMDL